jgi:pyruvate/2-oxoacid:ferredoxin oxidoreductase beta subunit
LNRIPERGEQVIAFAVVDGDEVAIGFGHAIGAARVGRGVSSVCGTSRTLPNISLLEAW